MKPLGYAQYLGKQLTRELAVVERKDPALHRLLGLSTAVLTANRESPDFIHTSLRGIWIMWTAYIDDREGLAYTWQQRAERMENNIRRAA